MERVGVRHPGGRVRRVDASIAVMAGLVVVLAAVAWVLRGWGGVWSGLVQAAKMLQGVWFRLLLGLAMAGFIQVVVPSQVIARWMGEGSGIVGVLAATVLGALTPGGPYVSFPIIASLYQSGAGVGPLAAYLTAWGVIPLNRMLVWEIPFLGSSFTLARYAASCALPVAVGVVVPAIAEALARSTQSTLMR